ncbi:hypothetical protein HID58_068226 [Brassica napus]|uniref:Cytochrome P450 n=1 Tax=Brassica napus TaxID=3708 RepID=A0ABQ7ZKQ4_BRANA|nr:hypothetical protein HID58_068226 [Brassica napus]
MAAMITVDFLNFFILIFLCFFSFVTISSSRDQKMALICLQALRLCPSSGIFTFYSLIFKIPLCLVSSASVAYEIFRTHDVNVSSREAPAQVRSRGIRADELERLMDKARKKESVEIGKEAMVLTNNSVSKLLMGRTPPPPYIQSPLSPCLLGLCGIRSLQDARYELERFCARLLNKARNKESVEIGKESMVLNNNIISKLLIGRSCSVENGEAEKVRESVTKTMGLLKKVLIANMLGKPLKKLGISLFGKEIRRVSSRFDELLERHLREHEVKPEKHQNTDMMDVLLASSRDENADYKITRNHIKLLLVELFLGGTDSAAKLIQWTMAEIINNPNILERLRQEMDSVVGKTSQRGFLLLQDLSKKKREKVLKFLPFGSGRRVCPGANLGYIFVETGVGMMVQCFDWRINGDKTVNMEETAARLSLTMAHPLICTLLPRTDPLSLKLKIPS